MNLADREYIPMPREIADEMAAIRAEYLAVKLREAPPPAGKRGPSVRRAKLLGGLAVVRRKRIFDFARLERDGEGDGDGEVRIDDVT